MSIPSLCSRCLLRPRAPQLTQCLPQSFQPFRNQALVKLLHQDVHRSPNTQSEPLIRETDKDRLQDQLVSVESTKIERQVPSPTTASASSDPSLPWYLRVNPVCESPRHRTPEFIARQTLPALPDNPPPVLTPFLEYMSHDLGMDYLTLLDLRHLDPPAALGTNLMMILGTARSERHLQTSADRACGYLRGEHKLRIHSDGLIMRQKLKTQLKRRQRKLKLLAAAARAESLMAGQPSLEVDSTEWVSVYVQGIKPANWEDKPSGEREVSTGFGGFMGFGTSENEKITMVVQFLTERKREELDLEGLWREALRESERRTAGVEGTTIGGHIHA